MLNYNLTNNGLATSLSYYFAEDYLNAVSCIDIFTRKLGVNAAESSSTLNSCELCHQTEPRKYRIVPLITTRDGQHNEWKFGLEVKRTKFQSNYCDRKVLNKGEDLVQTNCDHVLVYAGLGRRAGKDSSGLLTGKNYSVSGRADAHGQKIDKVHSGRRGANDVSLHRHGKRTGYSVGTFLSVESCGSAFGKNLYSRRISTFFEINLIYGQPISDAQDRLHGGGTGGCGTTGNQIERTERSERCISGNYWPFEHDKKGLHRVGGWVQSETETVARGSKGGRAAWDEADERSEGADGGSEEKDESTIYDVERANDVHGTVTRHRRRYGIPFSGPGKYEDVSTFASDDVVGGQYEYESQGSAVEVPCKEEVHDGNGRNKKCSGNRRIFYGKRIWDIFVMHGSNGRKTFHANTEDYDIEYDSETQSIRRLHEFKQAAKQLFARAPTNKENFEADRAGNLNLILTIATIVAFGLVGGFPGVFARTSILVPNAEQDTPTVNARTDVDSTDSKDTDARIVTVKNEQMFNDKFSSYKEDIELVVSLKLDKAQFDAHAVVTSVALVVLALMFFLYLLFCCHVWGAQQRFRQLLRRRRGNNPGNSSTDVLQQAPPSSVDDGALPRGLILDSGLLPLPDRRQHARQTGRPSEDRVYTPPPSYSVLYDHKDEEARLQKLDAVDGIITANGDGVALWRIVVQTTEPPTEDWDQDLPVFESPMLLQKAIKNTDSESPEWTPPPTSITRPDYQSGSPSQATSPSLATVPCLVLDDCSGRRVSDNAFRSSPSMLQGMIKSILTSPARGRSGADLEMIDPNSIRGEPCVSLSPMKYASTVVNALQCETDCVHVPLCRWEQIDSKSHMNNSRAAEFLPNSLKQASSGENYSEHPPSVGKTAESMVNNVHTVYSPTNSSTATGFSSLQETAMGTTARGLTLNKSVSLDEVKPLDTTGDTGYTSASRSRCNCEDKSFSNSKHFQELHNERNPRLDLSSQSTTRKGPNHLYRCDLVGHRSNCSIFTNSLKFVRRPRAIGSSSGSYRESIKRNDATEGHKGREALSLPNGTSEKNVDRKFPRRDETSEIAGAQNPARRESVGKKSLTTELTDSCSDRELGSALSSCSLEPPDSVCGEKETTVDVPVQVRVQVPSGAVSSYVTAEQSPGNPLEYVAMIEPLSMYPIQACSVQVTSGRLVVEVVSIDCLSSKMKVLESFRYGMLQLAGS